jgi:hypothetical protein
MVHKRPVVPTIVFAAQIFGATASYAQACPDGQSGKTGFVVERGERSRTEVFHDSSVVRTIMRSSGNALLETTQYEGLFDLDRLDRGRHSMFKLKTNLAKLFPLKTKQQVTAVFDVAMEGGTEKVRTVELLVLGQDEIYVGGCKYKVLKIERRQSRSNGAPTLTNIDYYAPDLKLVIAKEYKETNGRTSLIKFDKIYPIK